MSTILKSIASKYSKHKQNAQRQCQSSNFTKTSQDKQKVIGQTLLGIIAAVQRGESFDTDLSPQMLRERGRHILQNASKIHNIRGLQASIIHHLYDQIKVNPHNQWLINELSPLPQVPENSIIYFSQEQQENCKQQLVLQMISSKEKQIKQESAYQKKVNSYLLQLGAGQVQLTFLCQKMGWGLKFYAIAVGDGFFQSTAQVSISYNKIQQIIKESYKVTQKKFGRMITSLKILQIIFFSFPQIWDEIYEQKPTLNNSHIQNKLSLKERQIIQVVLNDKTQLIAQNKGNANQQFERERQEYLKQITCYNSELHLMVQKNPDILTLYPPQKIETSKNPQLWKVKRRLQVKYKGETTVYEKTCENASSKQAQKQIALMLVNAIYKQQREVLQRMMVRGKK